MTTKLFKSMNIIRCVSGARINLFRYTAKEGDRHGKAAVTLAAASDEHPFSIHSASIGNRWNIRGWKYAAMLLCMLTLGIGNAWAHDTHYNRANVDLAKGSTGGGSVYLIENNQHKTQSSEWDCGGSISGTHSKKFECHCEGWDDGYYFAGWNTSTTTAGSYTDTTATATLSFGDQSSTSSPGDKFYYAWTLSVKPTAASGDVSFEVDDLSTTYTKTINFTQTGGDAKEDFYDATIRAENGTWEVVSTTYNSSTQKVDVVVTYTSGRSKWTNAAGTRSDKATLSLKSKANEQYSVEVSANLPLVGISAGTGGSVTMDNAVETKTGSATFPVTGVDSESDFNEPTINKTSGEGTWAIISYSYSANTVTINYSHTGNGTYGTRASEATITLSAKTGGASQSVNVTASYPSLAITSAEDSKAYTPSLLTDGPGVATFHVSHADGLSDFVVPTEITPIDEGGTWTVGETTYTQSSGDPSQGTVQVNYTYNSGGYVGTRTAELTLTALAGATHTLTLSGVTEPEATNDASVTPAGGVATEYATFAEALAAANGLTGSTLTLLRNVDLGTITATNNISKAMTIDLNGKELRAAVNATSVGILTITAAVPVTIKDSKTGGKIINEIARNSEIRTIFVNKVGATLTLESGTISCHNTAQYSYGTNAIGGSATNAMAMETHTIQMAAGSVVNIRGGRVEAYGTRTVQAIRQLNDKNNTTTLNITGGEVYAEGPAYVYGIHSVGNVNVSGGTVTTYVNDHTTNGNAFYIDSLYRTNKLDTYILHRYNYGIYLTASSNATAANCYAATLNVTGGTINVTNINRTLSANGTTLYTEHTYGIYAEISATGAGAGKTASDGTKVQKACAVVDTFENATLNVTHAGVQAYGIQVRGCYNSKTNTITPLKIKNSTINVTSYQTAYGVLADAYVNWSSTLTNLTGNGGCTYGNVEMTNVTINATTTGGTGAYCAWASATSGTVAKAKAETGSTSTGNATFYGEYAVAGKITVNSGTYTAYAKTSSAYGIGSSDRAKCVRNVNGVFANRDAVADPQGALSDNTPTSEAYPELYIHGGNFSATTGTSTAVAVKSGGTTLIDGGTFNAYAGGSTAYGLYVTAGKTVANGVTFPASATTVAYGVYVYGGISDWSLFPYAGEVELNNCNATATARTTTDARGVYVNGLTKVYTQASFDAMKTANNTNYKTYGDYAQVGERAVVGKATINGGTYSATAETTTAYGIIAISTRVSTNKEAIAYNPLVVRNATVTAKTNTSTTAYGVQLGGGGLVENCTITATSGTTTASGVRAIDKTTVIKNSTISAKGTDKVYGLEGYIEASTAHGYCWHGDFDLTEAGSTIVTAESTGATVAYAIYLNAKAVNVASGNFVGDYATAANATINGGTYIAKTNGGTSGYALALTGTQTKGSASAQPEVLIEDGKFNGATAEIGTTGVAGHVQLKGGYYVHNTNLAKYIPEGYEEFPLPNDRPEYTEGYRYAIEPVGNHGNYVCQIGSTKYKTLEEALQVVTSGKTIIMIANYTMTTPGDYILPSGAKLLVPYSGQTATKETDLEVVEGTATPSLNLKLTFAEGVHLVSQGVIEAGAKQTGQGSSELTGQVYGSYGQIQLSEGSSITLESGATLYAWGYVTGKGEIIAKSGSKSYEMFQLGWYKGGNTTSEIYSNRNNYKIFPMTDYAYQNIECPITYYAGAFGYGRMAVKPYSYSAMQKPTAELVGTNTNSFFRMPAADASANTWVRKEYDLETDYTNWIMNSGATLSGISMNVGVSVNSADYYLPITSNFRIVLNYGELYIGNDVIFLPGSQLIVNKEATGIIASGKYVFFYDAEDWFTGLGHESVTAPGWSKAKTSGYYYYPATYSPSWRTPTSSPRKNVYARDKASIDKGVTPLPDAELFVHGKLIVNGSLYTSGDGNGSSIGRNANIHSTNEDAGKIIFKTQAPAATATKPLYKVCYMIGASEANNSWSDMIYGGQTTAYPALLQNGDGSYAQSAKTEAEKSWVYYEDKWQCWTPDGCFIRDAQNKPYANPAGYVQLTGDQPDENHLHHDAETGSRNFVWDENCYWWEVVSEPTAEGYYCSINADHNGDYNYYYYDSDASCWKIKKITVTWNVNGTNTYYSVGYGTKPEWLGATPTKSSSSDDYVWRWDGWTMGSDATVLANSDLPYVTENTTFTAHFYEKYYEYNITFKNDDGTVLESKNWIAGTTPSYEGTPTKNPTVDSTYEFNGTWTPDIATVSGSATYVANYTSHPRAYTITFLNYDMSLLGTAEVVYNGTLSNATYLAAVAPMTEDPYKPDNSAFSFEFAGWRLQGASSNGFAQVKGDQTYVAQFAETTKKYRIEFVDEDGETVLHYLQLEYGQTPSYTWDNPANKQNVEWNYTFKEWNPSEFAVVEGAQTYTAVYNKTKRKYDIAWKDGNGNTLKTDQVAYGETPEYSGATPTKNPTDANSFVFNNTWSPAIVAVVGEATYTAQFNETPRQYRVTWDAATNGGTCGTEYTDFSYNAAIGTLPVATKEGHTFNGWFTSATGGTQITTATKVTADVTYHAQWTVNTHKLAWNFDGGTPSGNYTEANNALAYGSAITYPTLSKTGYTFAGWSTNATSMPDADLTITASWTPKTNTAYAVEHYWQNINDDSYTKHETVNMTGTTDAATEAVAKNYTGFEAAQPFVQGTVAPDGSTVVNIYYNRKTYTIAWVDGDGNTEETDQKVKYGAMPSYDGETPTKTATAQYTYSFSGWSPAISEVTGDATYTATYTHSARAYSVTLNTNEGTINEGDVDSYTYGVGATLPTDVTREGYTFDGWYDNSGLNGEAVTTISTTATGNKEYWAKWSAIEYTITWLNWNSDPLKEPTIETTIEYGGKPGYSTANNGKPTRESSDGKTYEWDGWTTGAYGAGTFYSKDDLPEATGDATYYAHFRITAIDVASDVNISIEEDAEVTTTTVRVNGRLAVSSTLTTDDLILEATPSSSGTISGIENIAVSSKAYFDYKFDVDPWHWSAFGVPFVIDLDEAAPLKEKETPLALGTDYDIIYYNTNKRAEQGPGSHCWEYVDHQAEHKLIPGVQYMIAFNKPKGHVDTVRFTKAETASINYDGNLVLVITGEAAGNNNWNGIANPKMYHALLDAGVTECQVHDGGEIGKDGYYTYDMSGKKFFVGKSAFVQVPSGKSSVVINEATTQDAIQQLHAPRRAKLTASQGTRYDVQIAPSEEEVADRLLVLTDEDKADEYVIVSDLAKAGVSPVRAQMWVDRYGEKLCKNTTSFINNKADYPIVISTPKAGEYDIFINDQPDDVTMLYLTYDGEAIWNLSYGGYIVNLEKGTNTHYGLRIVRTPKITTGIEETSILNGDAIRKVLVNDQVFIIRGENVYTIDGQMVK